MKSPFPSVAQITQSFQSMVSGTSDEQERNGTVRMQTAKRNRSLAAIHKIFVQKRDGSVMTSHDTDEPGARTLALRCRTDRNTETRYAACTKGSCLVIPPYFQTQISP